MGAIKGEDVIGFFVGQKCVCVDCVSNEERVEVAQDKIITRDIVEEGDKLYFCCRCDKPIASARIMRLLSPIRSEKNKY